MTQRMFVCHAKSDIEVTSEIVDSLESALELQAGTLVASSLPGYASELHHEGDLHAMLTGASVMLALFSERSTSDSEFVFELGAAWALGIDVLPLLLGAAHDGDLPWPLRDRTTLRPQDPGVWEELISQLSQRLQVPQRKSVVPAAPRLEADGAPAPANAVSIVAPVRVSEPEVEPQRLEDSAPELDAAPVSLPPEPAYEDAAPALTAAPPVESPSEPAPEPPPLAAVAPAALFEPAATEREAPASVPPDAFEPRSDVRSSLPSYRMALEAGRALSDCVFNRAEAIDFVSELEEPYGRFIDAIGGCWRELRELKEFDVWLSVTENLLRSLPPEDRRIADWYELGYELAILHNLAGQGLFDEPARATDAEQLWRDALERFLSRAEQAQIPYEDLARVISLIENLVAPRAERDLANIARSLDELRNQALGADQHRAA